MIDFSEKDIEKYFEIIKGIARKAFENKEFEKCLKHIETAAELAYNFNWIYKDAELEKMLEDVSSKLLPPITNYSPIKGRFVFYDFFALDNRGLTQQYIRALISWNVEFLFLLEHDNVSQSTKIIQELQNYKKAEIFFLQESDNNVEKIKKAYNKIAEYRPEKLFMHLYPSDVVAVTTLAAFPEIIKYQINLTDHAFWLGVNITDYSLEFRNYGCNISIEKRGIPPERLLVQPYYPITDCESFKGFPPEITCDKTIIFSGGSFYKVYGENFAFFEILKRLLNENSSAVILFAGIGQDKPFRKFIYENHFEKRLILIGNRKDINYVFSNCDIYLSTFPFTGGLMAQFAAINNKPILAYTNKSLPGNFIEDLLPFGVNGNKKIVYTNLDDMMLYANRLISNKEFRRQEGDLNEGRVIDPKSFNSSLYKLILTNTNTLNLRKIDIDYKKLSSYYLEIENLYNRTLPSYLIFRFKLLSVYLFPKAFVKFVFNVLFEKDKFHHMCNYIFTKK